jgi:hypothetical protein
LALILDEAEHVRGYSVNRRDKANNLFDLLARAAHPPLPNDRPPARNDHELRIPNFWNTGPHFALFVGLTPNDIFSDPNIPLRDACAFLFDERDQVTLRPPRPAAYRSWCDGFFAQCSRHMEYLPVLSEPEDRARIVEILGAAFGEVPATERVMRVWVKLAALAPAILMCDRVRSVEDLSGQVKNACDEAVAVQLPWEK